MNASTSEQTERLVQFSRRQLWSVLAILLLLGVCYGVGMFFTLRIPPALIVPIAIVLAFAQPRRPKKGIDVSASSPAMQALRNDELRQFAQARAFRNGFFVLLAYPLVCAYALTWLAVTNPLPAVVGSSAWLGAITFLASLPWYDR